MKQRLYIFLIAILTCVNTAWAGIEYHDYDGDGVDETYNVVYLTVGGSNGNGNSSTTPVNSWANAYKKLPNYTGTTDANRDEAWEHNIIVVQNTTVSSAKIQIDETIAKGNGTQGIPATITGVWPWTAENTTAAKVKAGGMVTLHNEVDPTSTSSNKPTRIGADTKFKYIRFGGNSNCFLSMYLHDCTFDVGCSMDAISGSLVPSNGALKIGSTTRKAPDMQVFLFANTYTFSTSTTDGGFNALMKKPVTLTIKSGKFGRILSNRITGTKTEGVDGTKASGEQVKNRYIIGNPNNPLQCIVNVDIDPETSTGDWNPRGDVDDIAFLCAGMTQGAEYADVQFNIKRGRITTLVGAMQGNNITVCAQVTPSGLSNSSYFGRTETNILAENDNDVTIYRYYAACFGRMTGSQAGIANVAFYGKSTLNMYGGTIENGAYVSAGGVSGLVSPYNPDDYTNDQYIPYVDNTSTYRNYPYMGVKYQPYDPSKEIVHVKSMLHKTAGEEPEDIDLNETVTQMNIYGGVVRGGVFGGSYGYSTELVVDYAMPKAGSIWGKTNVNIYGGHIYGGVYGGGEGSSNYYNLATAANRDKFSTVATVYGNTNVNIYGGIIEDGIFGGGKGLDAQAAGTKVTITTTNGESPVDKTITTVANEFLDIAKVYGNTNVIIDPQTLKDRTEWTDPNVPEFTGPNGSWTYEGNIYGGGALGAVEGATNVVIKGGNITGNVFGGGLGEDGHADKAKVIGDTEANILGGTQGSEYAVYGGAQMALVDGNTGVILQGGTVGNAYGGGLGTNTMAANVTGDATVQLGSDDGTKSSKVLGYIYGANNLNGTPQGHAKVHVLKTTPRDGQGAEEYDVAAVYGGGNLAAYVPSDATLADKDKNFAEVLIENCDNSIEYVYGGGNAAPVPATQVTIMGANAIDNAFAGGNGAGADNPGADIGYKGFFSKGAATEYGTGIATINVQGGTIHHVYGGSNTLGYIKDHAVVNVNAAGTCPMDVAELYGGGKMAPGKAAQINITCTGEGKIDNVYGGAHMADLTGDITLNINGGNIGNAFGGNNESGTIDGTITVNVNWDEDACGTNSLDNVYGGGNKADYAGSPAVNILHGTVNENVFGGGLEATVTGDPTVTVNGGTVTLGAYGGGALADVDGTTIVKIISGTVGNAYGGGLGQLADAGAGKVAIAATVTGNANVIVSGGTTTNVFGCNNLNGSPNGDVTVTIKESANVTNVYGGGNQAAAFVSPVVNINGGTSDKVYGGGYGATAVLTGDPTVNVSGGTVSHDVYGGGALANVTGDPTVNVTGGTVTHDVYGGGALADVDGSTTVNLTGGAVGGAYGGALGVKIGVNGATEDVAAYVNGNTTVTLNATQITETGVFGCNNLNGTPKGHAYVHVTRTTPRLKEGSTTEYEDYDVPAVYGGGNLSAYEPTDDNDFAEVLIENCGNSIEYVYGGGNAAPVPATKVIIYGANAINNAFAGGNGAGDGNPGADVGYLDFFSSGSASDYGTGKAEIYVYGGTVNNVYGGSNTLGYIRTLTTVTVKTPDNYSGNPCELVVGNVFGGGNEADINCNINMNIDCSTGGDILYAGANNANVHGDITLNITSGTFGQVFCGNNEGGKIYGALKVNVDETGCWPVMIGELYACGYKAPYSVRGWNTDGTARTIEQFNALPPAQKETENFKEGKPYDDPEVNLISFTRIGKVFGGGYGNTAVLYGDTHVNVDPIKGKFAGKTVRPAYILDNNDVRKSSFDDDITLPYGITKDPSGNLVILDEVGSIGSIYGGGNAGAVYGDTHVNVGLMAKNKHLNADPNSDGEEVAVTITGDVFGGGNEAIVSGDTNVKIGEE